MYRHVVLWKFADDCPAGRKRENAIKIKAGFEELAYEVHGLRSIEVHIDPAPGNPDGADAFLDAEFENREAYRAFLEHPRLLAMLELVNACMDESMRMDFEDRQDLESEVLQNGF